MEEGEGLVSCSCVRVRAACAGGGGQGKIRCDVAAHACANNGSLFRKKRLADDLLSRSGSSLHQFFSSTLLCQ